MREKKWFEDSEGGDMEVSDRRENWYGNSGKGSGRGDRGNSNGSNNKNESASADAGWTATPYVESDLVKQAQALLQQHMTNQPNAYVSQWGGQLTDLLGQIQNRPEFSYDINGDALWNQYKDQYTQLGQQAMMDTMGQAAAMTGGYGNSYAQTVGQQAYQNYLQGLNDKIPDLYQLALSKYQLDGQDLLNRYGLMADAEGKEYGRYMDAVNQYYAQLDRLQNQYNVERDYDYGKYVDDRDFGYGQYIDDRNFDYQKERDAIADKQWQAEFNEAVRQWQATYDATYGAAAAAGGGGGSSGGGSGGGGGGGAPQDFLDALNSMKSGGSNVTVNTKSVIDLGYGPISGDTLSGLVAAGAVNATKQGNQIVFSNNNPSIAGAIPNPVLKLY